MDQDIINRHYDNVLIKILDREDSSPILIWCHVFDTSFDSCLQMHHSCRLKQLWQMLRIELKSINLQAF